MGLTARSAQTMESSAAKSLEISRRGPFVHSPLKRQEFQLYGVHKRSSPRGRGEKKKRGIGNGRAVEVVDSNKGVEEQRRPV